MRIILVWCLALFSTNVLAETTANVLVLNSYHIQYEWANQQLEGIKHELSGKVSSENIFFEFMDERRFIDRPELEKILFELYQRKYQDKKPNVIITNDDFALDFVLKYHAQLFPGIPVVFNGVNHPKDKQLAGKKLFTGIYEGQAISENLQLMKQLQPNLDTIHILIDKTSLGVHFKNHAELAKSKFQASTSQLVDINIWSDYSFETLLSFASKAPSNSAFLMVAIHQDSVGRYFSFQSDLPKLAEVSTVPVYGMWGTLILGSGAIGGVINDPYEHGRHAAQIAREILNGKHPSEIPIQRSSPFYPKLDYNVLKRFEISNHLAPVNTTYINQPDSYYTKHREIILTAGLIILLLLMIVSTLFYRLKQRIQREQFLDKLSKEDTLTGLNNRRGIVHELHRHIEAAEKKRSEFNVVYIDLDKFKFVNDTYGHKFGDNVLIEVSRRLKSIDINCSDIGRIGGDEFIILHQTETRLTVNNLANQIINLIGKPIPVGNLEIQVRCSMGIATYPMDGKNAETLIQHADTAMYEAKSSVDSFFYMYRDNLTKASARRMSIEQHIGSAIKSGELYLVFQPIESTNKKSTHHAEALIRWNHPLLGELSPNEFIPISEQSIFIKYINNWVIENACNQLCEWRNGGKDNIRLSINISAFGRFHRDIVDKLIEQLNKYDLEPHKLIIELTENIFIDFTPQVAKSLARVKGHGISISLDDFGSGYSHFAYLMNMPIDIVKIDQSLLKDLHSNESAMLVIKMIVRFAHLIGASVVAEGVSDETTFLAMKGTDVDYLQGFYLHRPMSAEHVDQHWFQANSTPDATSISSPQTLQ